MTARPSPERLAEIRAALLDTRLADRDPADTAIAELLAEIDALAHWVASSIVEAVKRDMTRARRCDEANRHEREGYSVDEETTCGHCTGTCDCEPAGGRPAEPHPTTSNVDEAGAASPAQAEPAPLSVEPARQFFLRCWDLALEGREIEGNDVMEWGTELGLLACVRATAPCGENCLCEKYIGDDFPTDCYRLAGEAQPRAVRQGDGDPGP